MGVIKKYPSVSDIETDIEAAKIKQKSREVKKPDNINLYGPTIEDIKQMHSQSMDSLENLKRDIEAGKHVVVHPQHVKYEEPVKEKVRIDEFARQRNA